MKQLKLRFSLSVILLSMTSISQANEMISGGWDFVSVDQQQVSMNRMSLFCTARPDKCPAAMSTGALGGTSGSGTGLVSPNTSSSANSISVVLAGDNSSVTLTTEQAAEDNNMNSNSETDAEIEYSEVLNYENN